MDNRHLIEQQNYDSEFSASIGIDYEKIVAIIRRSILWIVGIFIVTNSIAYLTIRWTKPLFKSESELKLDFKSEATALGLNTMIENQNLNHISGEIELLSSKLFFNKVIEAADIAISYNSRGNILNDERHRHSPFLVEYHLINKQIQDKEIDIDFVDNKKYLLTYTIGDKKYSKEHQFNEKINNGDMIFTITTTKYFKGKSEEDYFFVIRSKDALISYFEENFEVMPLNFQANTIKLTLTDHNRFKAQELVDIIDSVYLVYSQEQKSTENNKKIEWLNNELQQIEEKLEGYEDYFESFTIKNRTNNLDKVLIETIEAIHEIDSQEFEVNRRYDGLKALVVQIENKNENGLISYSSDLLTSSIINKLEEYNELLIDFNRVEKSYSQETFTYKNKINKLTSARNHLLANLQQKKDDWKKRLSELHSRKVQLENAFNNIPGKDREFKKAQLYYTLYEDHYLALMEARADFEIARAGTKNDIIILSSANLPINPISPDRLIIHGIGLVSGLMFSLIFVGIRYLMSNTITGLNELEKLTNSTILGVIPKYSSSKLSKTKLVIDNGSRTTLSESLRSIRTNLEFLSGGNRNKIISITSTVGSEGKTFVSVNLGGIIALSNRKVIIVDLDMRKPRIHSAFSHNKNDKGVSTILIGKHNLEESICKTSIDSLDYIPAGPTPPNPSELLLNGEFDQLLKELCDNYDLVILDTPPAAIVTDAILVMKKADIPIYVVRADYSKKSFIKTLNRLKHVNKFDNIALIMNGVQNLDNKKYGYGYYIDEAK